MQTRQQQRQEDWQAEWRMRVDGELAESARLHNTAAVAFERLNGRMTSAEADIAEIRTLRRRTPDEIRGWAILLIALAALVPQTICGGVALLIQLLPHLHVTP